MTNSRGNSRSKAIATKEKEMTTEAPTSLSEGDISVNLNTKVQFTVSIPAGLKIELDKFAKEHNDDAVNFARTTLAAAVGYTLPASARRSTKYASEDERKAAQAIRNKARRDLVNKLLEQYMEDEDEDEDEA